MEKKELLTRLESLLKKQKEGFNSQQEAISWSNKVAPLLKRIDLQYYYNFIHYSHKLNLSLSSQTIAPALNIMGSQIEMAIEEIKIQIQIEESLTEEIYFSPGSYLDIQKNLARVLRQANNSLWICDPYMDEKIVEEISNILTSEVRLLTMKTKALFKQRLVAAKKQFPEKTIEAKISDKSHDRYYIIDKDQVWTLGTSYNQPGAKATLLSKIKNKKEKQKIISDFEAWWSLARDVKI